MTKKPWRAGKDLSAVVENMEIGTGQRGDGRHAFVTREELVDLKLAKRRGVNSSGYVLNPGIDQDWGMPAPEYPTKPQNFLATGGFGSVLLEWDMAQYRGHSLTEIWRGTEDDPADAVLVATTPGQVYGDPVDPGWSGFYWIRFVNSAGVKGPWNGVNGTPAETQIGVKAVIDQIREEAAKSPVVSELRQEIKDAQGEAVKEAAIQTTEVVGHLREETTRTAQGIETQIRTLDESTRGSLNEVNGRIKKLDEEGGKAFLAMWSKKAGAEGITAGIGIVAGKDDSGRPVSQVAISASQLFVFDPNAPDKKAYPFAVSGGKVVIPKLMVEDAVIETMTSRRVVADEVKAGVSITTPTLRSATIQNGNFQVDSAGNMQAANANLNNVTSRGGVFYDIRAVRGSFHNVTIEEDCVVKGTVYANKIVGDLVKGAFKNFPEATDGLSDFTFGVAGYRRREGILTLRVADDQPFDRQIIILPVHFKGLTRETQSGGKEDHISVSIHTATLKVWINNSQIYEGRDTGNGMMFTRILDMPAGGGDVVIRFQFYTRNRNNDPAAGYVSGVAVMTTRKSAAGLWFE